MEGDFRFWSREKWNENQKMKEGGEEGKDKVRKNGQQTCNLSCNIAAEQVE